MSETAKQLFGKAIELPPDERIDFVASACAGDESLQREVVRLLRAHERAGDFLSFPCQLVAAAADEQEAEDVHAAGDRLGNFELLGLLGRGGAGAVWRARQLTPVVREVALKLLRRSGGGEGSTMRFQSEWQLLARMQHPSIAKVFEAGVFEDGRPWLAMELVEGTPVTAYAAGAAMPLRARLRLFVGICRAVQHAHQKGVVHRDLKPSNVLVTLRDGVPQPVVIDFGVAAADDARGGVGGTPEYMSPEQAGSDLAAIDARTDVYSLGVLLYELACGRRPHERPADDADARSLLRAIRVDVPPPPSAHARQRVPRDLDRVVACAMAKDSADRYASAAALADDVERVLAWQPITAAPSSAVRHAALFVRRHRLGAAAAAAVVVALVLGSVAAYSGYRKASRAEAAARSNQAQAERAAESALAERDRAARESQKAKRALELFDEIWRDVDVAHMSRPDSPLGRMVAGFEQELPARTAGEPEVEMRLRRTLAWVRQIAGDGVLAHAHATRAVALSRQLGDLVGEAEALVLRAEAMMERDRAAAEQDSAAAMALIAGGQAVSTPMRSLAFEQRAALLERRGQWDEAVAMAEEALRQRETAGDVRGTVASLLQLAHFHVRGGDLAAAERFAEKARAACGTKGERQALHVEVLALQSALRSWRGDTAAAEAAQREALRVSRLCFGDDHWRVAGVMADLGALLHTLGRHAEADPLLGEALARLRRHLGEDSFWVTQVMTHCGRVALELGRMDEAEQLLKGCVERVERLPEHDAEAKALALHWFACLQWRRDRRAAACAMQQQAFDLATRSLHPGHRFIPVVRANLGLMLGRLGDVAAAQAHLRPVIAYFEAEQRLDDAAALQKRLDEILQAGKADAGAAGR